MFAQNSASCCKSGDRVDKYTGEEGWQLDPAYLNAAIRYYA